MPVPFDGVWYFLTMPFAQIAAGAAVLVALCISGNHLDETGELARARIGGAIAASIATYTFVVCVCAQFIPASPDLAELIERGFDNDRIAWLLVVVIIDGGLRIWAAVTALD